MQMQTTAARLLCPVYSTVSAGKAARRAAKWYRRRVEHLELEQAKKRVEELRAVMTESKEKIASGELKAKSYYDFANEDEYQKLLDSVAP